MLGVHKDDLIDREYNLTVQVGLAIRPHRCECPTEVAPVLDAKAARPSSLTSP